MFAITLDQVSKDYQNKNIGIRALDKVSLTIKKGAIFGIIGESGSGKSTLLRLIHGLEQPNEGQVKIGTLDLFALNKSDQVKTCKKMSMVFQQFNLLSNQTIFENVALPLRLNKQYEEKKVLDALAFVDLLNKKQQYPKQLSGGQKQRVGIARALVTQPDILLCDEPTSALDDQTTEEIIELLDRINKEYQTTIVIVSHELSFIQQLCQEVAILDSGVLMDVLTIQPKKEHRTYGSYYDRVKECLQ